MRYLKLYIILFLAIGLLACKSSAQSIDKITRKCPNGNLYSTVLVQANGDIVSAPCASRKFQFTGVVDFTGALVVGLPPSPPPVISLPDGTIPLVDSGVLALSGNSYISASSRFLWVHPLTTSLWSMHLTLDDATGEFEVSNNASALRRFHLGSSGAQLEVNGLFGSESSTLTVLPNSIKLITQQTQSNGIFADATDLRIGDVDYGGNSVNLNVYQSTRNIELDARGNGTPAQGINSFVGGRFVVDKGTDRPADTVFIPIGQSQLVVSNSNVGSASIVIAIQRAGDATCSRVDRVNPINGSFTIFMDAACTAATEVSYMIFY